jgi:transcriptional regulator with XRE-family HTH domain
MRCDPQKLRQFRERKGITQEKLARDSRAGLRTIQRAEGGQSIRSETAAFIAEALAIPMSELRAEDNSADIQKNGSDNLITLRRVNSGKALIETLHRSDMCRLDCDVDPDGSNVETLKALASLIEARIPDPLSWTEEHLFGSLAERLEATARLNDYLRELEPQGIGVFAGSYSEKVRMPTVSPYDEPSIKSGTRPMPAILTRIVIAATDRDRLVIEKDYRWPVAIWSDDVPDWDVDLDTDVPF